MLIELQVTVPLGIQQAFAAFIYQFDAWWPRQYTWSGDSLVEIRIGAHAGGLCSEFGPHGFRCDWGRVIELSPSHHVSLTWQISPDRVPIPDAAKATQVEVSFKEDENSSTMVTLRHEGFERHGNEGNAYRDALASPEGWQYLLEQYRLYCHSAVEGATRDPQHLPFAKRDLNEDEEY